MRAIVVFASLSVLLITARPGAAQGTPDSLTLSDALALAESRNPSFAAARDAIAAAQGARVEAARRPNPALTLESQAFESSRPGLPDGGREFSVRFDQELELAGRRGLRIAAADASVRASESQARNRLRQLQLEVKRAYMQAVLAAADRAVAQTSLDEIDRVLGVSRARFQEGEISGAELRRLQVERLKFVDDVFAAELALRNARSALLALIGASDLSQPIGVSDILGPVAPPPGTAAPSTLTLPDPTLIARALAGRADVAAARQEVLRTETETRLQRALRSPSPTVGGGYTRDFSGSAVTFGVTLPIPFFNSLNAGSVARAEAEQRRAANEEAATELAVRLDLQQATNAVTINRERVAYIEREYLTPARESRDIAAAAYRIGAADLIDFLDAQRAFRDTARTYNRALYESRVSTFELEAAVGEPTRQE